ncbi:MAG: ATP-dependent zinc metalloprotease FtsH [Lachnospiraceae bacterium]|nr:ATP-dependent zinc metalloprotease FtsH [Lachnospiraceae bacterium]
MHRSTGICLISVSWRWTVKLKRRSGFGFYGLIVIILVGLLIAWSKLQGSVKQEINHKEFESHIEKGDIAAIRLIQNSEVPTGEVRLTLDSGLTLFMYTPDINKITEELDKKFPDYTLDDVKREGWFATYILPSLILIVFMIVFFTYMNGSAGGGSKMMNFGKSHAKLSSNDNKIKFPDVAGLDEEKADLEEIVDFLKNAQKYIDVGARIPKGVILVGPPGTGKTLFAKAIAGEANVPFFSISGSDFVEMFVGVGASRVRDLFEEAKKNAPCIVFIDEIDAVARRRGTGMGGGHDEREQTLNQLLVEMDGFGVNEGIIVLAATNRVDILDPAIMRPGRFDRKIAIGTPDVKGRLEILNVHSKNKSLSDDVDLDEVSKSTSGFTGADLENLMNEAAIRAAKSDRKFIKMEDIRESFLKVGVGPEKKSKVVTDKEKRITAFHESGHAILHYILPDIDPVNTVSIIPTGFGAGGYTMAMPEEDVMFETRGRMLNEIVAILGGRAAESIVLDDITTGASSDIKKATHMAKNMVMRYGMSDNIGAICYDDEGDEVFIGRDLAHTRGYSDSTASKLDEEVKHIIDTCYEKAVKLIGENRDKLDACAQLLLEKEKINRAEFEQLFEGA